MWTVRCSAYFLKDGVKASFAQGADSARCAIGGFELATGPGI